MQVMVNLQMASDVHHEMPKSFKIPLLVLRGALTTQGQWAVGAGYEVRVTNDTRFYVRVQNGELVFTYCAVDIGKHAPANIIGFEVSELPFIRTITTTTVLKEIAGTFSQVQTQAENLVSSYVKTGGSISATFNHKNMKPTDAAIPQVLFQLLKEMDKRRFKESS